jgi:hypothetical protein
MQKIRIEQHTFTGSARFAAWLFTIGFLHLTLWKAGFAIVIWPCYWVRTSGRRCVDLAGHRKVGIPQTDCRALS